MTDKNVRLQNLRDFTVQIRRVDNGAIVGTGIAVSMGGQVVTCAHVARGAGVEPRASDGAEIGVYFPQARGDEVKARRAKVAACFPQHDDDVVLLQLTGGPSPLAPEQIPILGKAEDSCFHPFRSYGYRSLEAYIAGWADGTIQDCVEPPPNRHVQADPVQLESAQINRGMSGAAVLDVERNLVVGLVSETWFPDVSTKDRDTAWAVNARVLSLAPLNLHLQDEPYPKRPASQPKTDMAQARAAVAPTQRIAWNNAPTSLAEWVGRDDLLQSITADWADPNRHVTGLIGFGGEGKSSLARKWVDSLPLRPEEAGEGPGMGVPDGVFWWGFYERPSVDEFFEAALNYMSGGRIDPRLVPSSNLRAQIIGAMLGAGRYLFVLDGLEVMQHQDGDPYGLLKSADLRELLGYFAAPGHASFCLVTSRAPLLDLMEYTTYTHRDVDRLSAADGRDLLRKVGVRGADAQLDKLVADWDGHALTLSLLSGLLVEQYGGDVAHLADLPAPVASEPRYQRVHRVLRRYDEHLTEAERAFLTLFSAFRTPVHESAFDKVFRPLLPLPKTGEGDAAAFNAMVKRLINYRILRFNSQARHYTAHPLIRAYYEACLAAGDLAQARNVHINIANYYLSTATNAPFHPTLDDLMPLIETVHHFCCAGNYDEAWHIYQECIDQGSRGVLAYQLVAYETDLSLMLEFFPGGDVSLEPLIGNPLAKSSILNEIGICLFGLGRLGEAATFYERSKAIDLYTDRSHAVFCYQNLAELYIHLGDFAASRDATQEALTLARRAGDMQGEHDSLIWLAWADHLCGDLNMAGMAFQQAEKFQRETEPDAPYLPSNDGILHADHLRRAGHVAYARQVIEANLEINERERWLDDLSRCYRVLGDLDADTGHHQIAHQNYNEALKIAHRISSRPVLIEALLARGRWAARHAQDLSGLAFNDLNEALGYALAGGYRIYQADIRIGLAWAHLATGDMASARRETERARAISADMGYHWGKVDAEEVLSRMAG